MKNLWLDPLAWIILVVCIAGLVMAAKAQDHEHGVGNLPDWYDPGCCNLRDCRPVEDKDIEFVTQGGSDFVRHIPTGLLFQRSQWKTSQDERYHVCIYNGGPLCVYIRAGA